MVFKWTYLQAWELYIQYSHWTWQIEKVLCYNGLLVLQHGESVRRQNYDDCHRDHRSKTDFLQSLDSSCGVAFVCHDQLVQTNPGSIPEVQEILVSKA
jgi:hypothetical protein